MGISYWQIALPKILPQFFKRYTEYNCPDIESCFHRHDIANYYDVTIFHGQ